MTKKQVKFIIARRDHAYSVFQARKCEPVGRFWALVTLHWETKLTSVK